jgi:hypothetical protein
VGALGLMGRVLGADSGGGGIVLITLQSFHPSLVELGMSVLFDLSVAT